MTGINEDEIPVINIDDIDNEVFSEEHAAINLDITIRTDNREYEGIFTECKKQRTFKEYAKELLAKYEHKEGMDYILGRLVNRKNFDVQAFVQGLEFLLRARVERDNFADITDTILVDKKKSFHLVYADTILQFTQMQEAVKEIEKKVETRQNFVNFMNDILDQYGGFRIRHDKAEIQAGEEIEKRSVAMYRIAQLLGLRNLIPPTYLIKLQAEKNGVKKEKEGIFQMKIKDGHSYGDLSKDNPLSTHKMDKNTDPIVFRQAANLMLLDYICGYLDRFSSDIVFQFREINGVTRMIGLFGVNNSLCMGSAGVTAAAAAKGATLAGKAAGLAGKAGAGGGGMLAAAKAAGSAAVSAALNAKGPDPVLHSAGAAGGDVGGAGTGSSSGSLNSSMNAYGASSMTGGVAYGAGYGAGMMPTGLGDASAYGMGHSLSIDSIKYMSSSAATAIMNLDIKRMRLDLNALCFSEFEINHMVARIKMITQSLRERRIQVVPDDKFNKDMDIKYIRELPNFEELRMRRRAAIRRKIIQHRIERRIIARAMEWPPRADRIWKNIDVSAKSIDDLTESAPTESKRRSQDITRKKQPVLEKEPPENVPELRMRLRNQ